MRNILVADKSTFTRIMLSSVLDRLGFNVVGKLKDGQEVLDKWEELKPHVVLLDAELEKIDAIELIRIITSKDPSVVVVLLIPPAYDVPDIIIDAVRAGAKGYLKKPISEKEIEERLRSAMRRR